MAACCKAVLLGGFLMPLSPAVAATTLDGARAAGTLSCGIVTEISDETKIDTHGDLSALGVEFCRAVSAAILGSRAPVTLHSYPSAAYAYAALQRGEIALMMGDTPQDGLARRYGVQFLTPEFFDGQGLMVHKDRGIASLKDLAGKPVCFIANTDANSRLLRAQAAVGVKVALFPFEEIGEMEAALVDGRCAAETHDVSKLAGDRTLFHGMVRDYEILPERLSLDPYAPVVRDNDPNWAAVVNGVFFSLVQAEEMGVTRDNAQARRGDTDQQVQLLLNVQRGTNWGLFLPEDWSFQAIRAVGNYGEMINRTTGARSPLRLDRGLNGLAGQGGLIWAPPIRP